MEDRGSWRRWAFHRSSSVKSPPASGLDSRHVAAWLRDAGGQALTFRLGARFLMSMQTAELPSLVSQTLDPQHFFHTHGSRVRLESVASETVPWELFRGHLLDANRTRERRTFVAWHVWFEDSPQGASHPEFVAPAAPVASVRWDQAAERLHVTRNLLSRGWEAYESRPGVIETRPVLRWLPELIATLDVSTANLADRSADQWEAELQACVAQAWYGVSRLPITSVESPHPLFSMGRMAYLPNAATDSLAANPRQLARLAWSHPEHPDAARRLEAALRAASPGDVSRWFESLETDSTLRAARARLIQNLFHHVSLSPFTQFTERWIELLAAADAPHQLGEESVVDLLGYMLRHLIRHLSAYDLVTFHSFGANYPDALWLDRLLRELLVRLEHQHTLFLEDPLASPAENRRRRLRRRAVRHAWLVRKAYEGHRVPDAPTSRGEHQRVMPGEWSMVPEEQITQPTARRKRLFEHSPTDQLFTPRALEVLDAAVADLALPDELIEMGAATFLDRPLGIFKQNGEVDRTPLLAYDAASRSLVATRLAEVRRSGVGSRHVDPEVWDALVDALPIEGVAAANLPGEPRPGVIMLEDARHARPDFVVRAILPGSLRRLADTPGVWTDDQRRAITTWGREMSPQLLVRTANADTARAGKPWLTLFDSVGRPKAKLALPRAGDPTYAESYGVEYLREGMHWAS
jgi:hypothetical protein